jgi:chromosomal replication initiator protein
LSETVSRSGQTESQAKHGVVPERQPPVEIRVVAGGSTGAAGSFEPAKVPPEQSPVHDELRLNARNTFDAFIVGSSNNFAYAAALAVARAPGSSYNPLFLYGGVGLGKTHLLHAIGHYVAGHKPGQRIACVSAEQFTNEYLEGIENKQLARFREKYRQTKVLLVDDVQFLARNERIQEEFFHTFNALHEDQRQIVLTSDRPAGEIENLQQRLISRFDGGLVTELRAPDVETRLAVLHEKARGMGVELPEPIMNFVAKNVRTNIRELEGALIRLASYAGLTGKALSLEVVEDLLGEIFNEEVLYPVRIDAIQKKVAEHFDIRLEDMASRRRPEKVAFPRQVAMFISRQMTAASLGDIGQAFGGRDHATVLRACQLVKDRMEVDSQVRRIVSQLEKQLTRRERPSQIA